MENDGIQTLSVSEKNLKQRRGGSCRTDSEALVRSSNTQQSRTAVTRLCMCMRLYMPILIQHKHGSLDMSYLRAFVLSEVGLIWEQISNKYIRGHTQASMIPNPIQDATRGLHMDLHVLCAGDIILPGFNNGRFEGKGWPQLVPYLDILGYIMHLSWP